MKEGETGLSTVSLVLLFLLGVVVCAVFFSLGFLVGYRERSSSNTAEVERVTPTGDIPPALNPPPAKEGSSARQHVNRVSVGSTAQPPEAQSDQKGGNVASGTRVSAEGGAGVTAPAAAEAAPSTLGHESLQVQVPASTRQAATG